MNTKVRNGEIVECGPGDEIVPHPLSTRKARMKARVDARAQHEREKYASTIWGQEVIYTDKESEAKALDADSTLAESETPYLTKEATATGQTREEVKTEVLAKAAAWRDASSTIEANRVALKRSIDAASKSALKAIDIDSGWS